MPFSFWVCSVRGSPALFQASQVVLMVKSPLANAGRLGHRFDPWVRDPLEEGTATHPSLLARRLPWTEEPGGLQSTGSESDTLARTHPWLLL